MAARYAILNYKNGRGRGKPSFLQNRRPLSPETKIKEIERLSAAAKLPKVGAALRGIYDSIKLTNKHPTSALTGSRVG